MFTHNESYGATASQPPNVHLGSFLVEEGQYRDMVWQAEQGLHVPLTLDHATGTLFQAERIVGQPDGTPTIVGTLVRRTILEAHTLDDVQSALVECHGLGAVQQTVRRLRGLG